MSKTAVNSLMYNSLKRMFKSHKSLLLCKTGKSLTIDNPFAQIHNEQVQIIRLNVTFFTEILTYFNRIHLDKASATTFSDPGIC